MDGRVNNGGHKNAGRKSKASEQELIERLTPLTDKAFNKLDEAIEKGHSWALKLFMQYKYGQPKQFVEQAKAEPDTPLFVIDLLDVPDENFR